MSNKVMSLREQNKQKARANILRAAAELIGEEGIDAATTREIARRAGVSYQTLYNYFPTKADIAGAILESEAQFWKHGVDAVIKRYEGDLVGSLTDLIRQSIEQIDGPHKELWAYIALSAMNKDLKTEDVGAAMTIAHEQFYALLNLAQGMGHLKPDLDLHLMAHTLFNLVDYAMLRFFIEPIDSEQFIANQREIINLLVDPYLN